MAHVRSGQVSTEYTMLLSALLLVLVVVMVVMMGQFAQQSAVVQQRLADHALVVLASSAQEVWVGGPGAQTRVVVDLPSTFDSTRSAIGNKTIQLYLTGWGDVSRATPFNVSGYWPSRSGKFYAVVYNNNSSVVIRPAGGMFINVSSIYMSFSVPTPGMDSKFIQIVNQADVNYTITQSITCPPNTDACTYPTGTRVLEAGHYLDQTLFIMSSTTGLRSGNLHISAVPTAPTELITEEIDIPITLRVD